MPLQAPPARSLVGDVSGAVADLGVFVPLAAALVLINGVDPAPLLVAAGALVILAGTVFRIPFPVQPLKALTALAVAKQLAPDLIHAAGLEIGVILLVISLTGLADRVARIFTKPIIRSLQFGVGTLLVFSAVKLVLDPPSVFGAAPDRPVLLALFAVVIVAMTIAVRANRYWLAPAVLAVAALVAALVSMPALGHISLYSPSFHFPPWSLWPTAFTLLVIPQIPLTYGNAIVGVSDLAREHFGDRARAVTPGRVAVTCGVGNVVSAFLGGMPMCHGSSGFTAHVRLGATTARMNLILGTTFIVIGVIFPAQVIALFSLLPVWVLAAFLAYAGIRHALLVLDLRGLRLVVAVGAGLVGVITSNLAITTLIALLVEHSPRVARSASAAFARLRAGDEVVESGPGESGLE